jgi:hypothetical protein
MKRTTTRTVVKSAAFILDEQHATTLTLSASVMDMLDILQEYQSAFFNFISRVTWRLLSLEKKSSKSSSRAAAIEAKKKAINDACYAEINEMKQEGTAYMSIFLLPLWEKGADAANSEQVKARVEELKEQQAPSEAAFADIAAFFGNRSVNHFLCQLDTFSLKWNAQLERSRIPT